MPGKLESVMLVKLTFRATSATGPTFVGAENALIGLLDTLLHLIVRVLPEHQHCTCTLLQDLQRSPLRLKHKLLDLVVVQVPVQAEEELAVSR